MEKPTVSSFQTLLPLIVHQYERYLPTAFDESLTMLQKMNKIIQQLDSMGEISNGLVAQWNSVMEWIMSDGLQESIDVKLDEMYADGTLTEVVDGVFDSITNKLTSLMGVDVADYGALGDGTNQTTSIQNAVNAIITKGSGVLRFGDGTYVFENIVIPRNVFIAFEGQNARGTIFKPVSANSQLIVIGGNPNTDYVRFKNIRVESTFDHDYNKPLFDLKFMRNVNISDITCDLSGTGTLFQLDTSYLLSVRDCNLRTNRYSVAFDFTNITKPEEQQDTIKFDNVVVMGNMGCVVRRSGGNYHTIRFDGFKVVANASHGDWTYKESLISVNAVAGGTQLTLNFLSGFAINDPIAIGYGEFFEFNKVVGVSGTTIFLAKPLRFNQDSNRPVINSGVGVSLANPINVTFDSCHWEGLPIGIMTDGAKGIRIVNNYKGARELLRINGGTQDVKVELNTMDSNAPYGGGTLNGSAVVYESICVNVPAYNVNTVNIARIYIEGQMIISGSATTIIARGLPNGSVWYSHATSQGFMEKTLNVPSGFSASKYMLITQDNGNLRYKQKVDGTHEYRNGETFGFISNNVLGVNTGTGFKINDGTWNGGRFYLGSYQLWVDATGKLRMKNGTPANDTDGTIIGTQV